MRPRSVLNTDDDDDMTTNERDEFIRALDKHRGFLRHTVQGLTDEQARLTPTASTLCLGGLVKHVAAVEETWRRFVVDGPIVFSSGGGPEAYMEGFRMGPGETVAGLLDRYAGVAAETDEAVRMVPSLDYDHPLPEAPWFEPGARWSARRVLMHILAETAQHAGHADIIRETIDGARTMG
jgi:hypothetical protein